MTEVAPSHDELVPLVLAAATVADHGALRPWRLIELRGDARVRLGAAFVAASSVVGPSLADSDAARLAAKPLRAELLIAVVAVHKPSVKVTEWEQDAAASGVAHVLSLLLDEAGWGVMWRTGPLTRAAEVHAMHDLAANEKLLGWLYVGALVDQTGRPSKREPLTPEELLTELH